MKYHQDKIQDYLICEKSEINVLPFFREFDNKVNLFTLGTYKKNTKYIIWGGVAANLLLQLLEITPLFYSIHDIEFFIVSDNKIFYNQKLYTKLNGVFKKNNLLPIGGLSVVKRLSNSIADRFQENRLNKKDGDLYMNSITLEVSENQIKFSAPLTQLKNLIDNHFEVFIKDFDDLSTPEKLEYRIRRTIPKIIRLQEVSGFYVGETAKNKLISMAAFLNQKNLKNEIYLRLVLETIMRVSIFRHIKLDEIKTLHEFKDNYESILNHELFDCIIGKQQREIINNSKEVMTKSVEKYKEYMNDNSYKIFKRYSKN